VSGMYVCLYELAMRNTVNCPSQVINTNMKIETSRRLRVYIEIVIIGSQRVDDVSGDRNRSTI
jgi:hypothetical protein